MKRCTDCWRKAGFVPVEPEGGFTVRLDRCPDCGSFKPLWPEHHFRKQKNRAICLTKEAEKDG